MPGVKNSMKILFIPTSYPDETNPVRDVFIYEQAVALSKAGHDIRILHPQKQPSKKIFSRIKKDVKIHVEEYATRYSCPVKTFMEERLFALNKVLFVNVVKKLYAQATADGWTPDVIYAHFSCWAGNAAVNLGKKHKIPVVVMEHFSGYMSDYPRSKLVKGLDYVVENADALICVSDNLKDRVVQLTKTNKRIYVVPNMLDPRFQYTKRTIKEKFVFSTVCNLNERKRVKELVHAFCKAFGPNDNVELLIGGDGPEKMKIVDYIHQNHRKNQIILLGRLNRRETIELYKKANCFALVSAHETFGIVWREAMATGLPVITSNHEGWSTQDWSDEFGIMVPVDDEKKLIVALQKMRNCGESYDSKLISDYCEKCYSERAVVAQLESVFSHVRSTFKC